jgi:hypothetical protein
VIAVIFSKADLLTSRLWMDYCYKSSVQVYTLRWSGWGVKQKQDSCLTSDYSWSRISFLQKRIMYDVFEELEIPKPFRHSVSELLDQIDTFSWPIPVIIASVVALNKMMNAVHCFQSFPCYESRVRLQPLRCHYVSHEFMWMICWTTCPIQSSIHFCLLSAGDGKEVAKCHNLLIITKWHGKRHNVKWFQQKHRQQ